MADEIVRVVPTPINPIQVKGAIAFSAEHSRVWAEGSDEEVEKLGGEHSAKGWAGEAREEGKQYTDEQIAQARVDITEQINTNSLNVLQQSYGYTDNAISAEATIREAQAENYVKKNESPTLDAGGEYRFNFVAGTQRAKLELTGLGFELKNETTGAEINLRSYDDVQIQAPQDGNLSLIQKGEDGARIELIKDITINSASGREIEIKQRQGSAIKIGATGDISLEPTAGHVVFSDGNPVITTKDKATTSALGVVKVDGETISANNGVISVAQEGWQKPSDWVDIRSGALPNSVYFLVGHSADYATYPTFGLTATTSTGTYDVFVDGIKQATTASGTATELNWQTLALTSGWDVTTPSALHTHIVRVTPTTSTATLTGIKTTLGANYGILWAHFNVANPINLDGLFNQGSNNDATKRCYVLQAVTSYNGEIQISVHSGIWGAFHYCRVLKEIPTLVYVGSSTSDKSAYRTFRQCYELKKVKLVNFGRISGESTFMSTNVQEIVAENSCFVVKNYCFNDCKKLKKLPPIIPSENMYLSFTNLANLEPTFVDFSASTSFQNITFTGDNNNFVSGLKGIVLNPNATATNNISFNRTGLDRTALINLFNSMPTVSADLVCNITGCTGAADLTAEDLAIATTKGWTVTR